MCNMQQAEQGYHVCIDVLVRHREGGLLYRGEGGDGARKRERKWRPLQTITAQTLSCQQHFSFPLTEQERRPQVKATSVWEPEQHLEFMVREPSDAPLS